MTQNQNGYTGDPGYILIYALDTIAKNFLATIFLRDLISAIPIIDSISTLISCN